MLGEWMCHDSVGSLTGNGDGWQGLPGGDGGSEWNVTSRPWDLVDLIDLGVG